MDGDLIQVHRDPAGIGYITINRPKSLNSLTQPMITDLARAFKALDGDDTVAVIVISGRGRAFCSGVDLTAAESVFKGDVKNPDTNPVIQMERCRKPIIGAIAGFAVTAGFEIALACDILVAGKETKFIDSHTKLNSTRADKLVFIHSNIRLISRFEESYKEGPFKKWDINPEANIIDDSHVRLEELRWESLDINDVDGQKDERAKDQSNVTHGSKLLGQSSAASSNIPCMRSQEMRSTQSQMTRFLQQRAPLDPKAKGKQPQ